MFENTAYRRQFLSCLGCTGQPEDCHARLDAELDRMAELVHTTGWFAK